MRNKKLIYAAVAILILLFLFIPWSKAGSAPVATTQPEAPADSSDTALHTLPATSTLASSITKTIAILETGGTLDCSRIGLSGERGCHQFLPSTWRAYSAEIYGSVVEQTPEAAEYVTLAKVQRWLDAGYTPRQIFLIWNQGNAGKCKAGVNKLGVPYDSCAYADGAVLLLQQVIHSA